MTHTPKDTGREIMHRWGKKCLAPISNDTDHIFDCDAGTAAIIRAILEERKAERERCAVLVEELVQAERDKQMMDENAHPDGAHWFMSPDERKDSATLLSAYVAAAAVIRKQGEE